MVVGLGVDLTELDRVERALSRWGERIVSRLMAPPEAARLPVATLDRARALALAIAGKEAAAKALGTGWTRGVRWRDVAIHLGPPPCVSFHAKAEVRARVIGSRGPGELRFEIRGNLVLAEYRLLS